MREPRRPESSSGSAGLTREGYELTGLLAVIVRGWSRVWDRWNMWRNPPPTFYACSACNVFVAHRCRRRPRCRNRCEICCSREAARAAIFRPLPERRMHVLWAGVIVLVWAFVVWAWRQWPIVLPSAQVFLLGDTR